MQNMQRFIRMKKMLGRKNPFIIWRFLVFKFNEDEIQKASDLADQYDVDRIVFAAPYIDYERFPHWIPKNKKFQMKPLQDYLESPKASATSSPPSSQKSSPERSRTRCDWHYVSAAINSDGSIAPCCALFGKADDFASYSGNEQNSYMAAVNNENIKRYVIDLQGASIIQLI